MMIPDLQKMVGEWGEKNFPEENRITAMRCTLGVAEEAGELAHAILKRDQGIRGTREEHDEAAQDAIGDIVVYLMHLCHTEGWDFRTIIWMTVDHVLKRDWLTDPAGGFINQDEGTPHCVGCGAEVPRGQGFGFSTPMDEWTDRSKPRPITISPRCTACMGQEMTKPIPRGELACDHERQLIVCPTCCKHEDGAADAIIERAEQRWRLGSRYVVTK